MPIRDAAGGGGRLRTGGERIRAVTHQLVVENRHCAFDVGVQLRFELDRLGQRHARDQHLSIAVLRLALNDRDAHGSPPFAGLEVGGQGQCVTLDPDYDRERCRDLGETNESGSCRGRSNAGAHWHVPTRMQAVVRRRPPRPDPVPVQTRFDHADERADGASRVERLQGMSPLVDRGLLHGPPRLSRGACASILSGSQPARTGPELPARVGTWTRSMP